MGATEHEIKHSDAASQVKEKTKEERIHDAVA